MKDYLVKDPWRIIEDGFHETYNKVSESIFSIANGYMGVRGTFEETYSGETLQGSYISGIYYPDKTRVGWWKNGYPEYFAKVLNSVNWIGIDLYLNEEKLDLKKCDILEFRRELDMQHSVFSKKLKINTKFGIINIESSRFCSQVTKELGVIKYTVTSESFQGNLQLESYLDINVRNQDANYDEFFWEITHLEGHGFSSISAKTKKTEFNIHASMYNEIGGINSVKKNKSGKSSEIFQFDLTPDKSITLHKFVSISSDFHQGSEYADNNHLILQEVQRSSFDSIYKAHKDAWIQNWSLNDIEITGDTAAQQGLRFNILQLYQTYDGSDHRLNIGPKGFTGEKYGGCTYWDTEAYCLPFYLSTANPQVAKNLLIYRYHHLEKAIENASKLGFKDGAALYPMVTMNGEECHNEWEITFEEIHRNGAIAYAIYSYIEYSGDSSYMLEYGLEVLIGIARFWSQRFQYSENKKSFVILGVTGPNEYENNVNNNWYTNFIARWCIQYCSETIDTLNKDQKNRLQNILDKTNFKDTERQRWNKITSNTYLPYNKDKDIFIQQDGFLDKELQPASHLPDSDIPIHQHWSWDRILRSCYIKQADVLQGLYFFEHLFDKETLKRNFDFYEPMTVHESSLSPCIHAILACRIGDYKKAYEMYLRTARLDLDDYNNDTEDGLHITSMAGTWLAVVKGFGGMQLENGVLALSPALPESWKSMSFRIVYKKAVLKISVSREHGTVINNLSSQSVDIQVFEEPVRLAGHETKSIHLQMNTRI